MIYPSLEIKLNNVSFERNFVPLFKNINVLLKNKSLLHVVGPNGCGKTTFLRVVAGLLSPTDGRIHINGENKSIHFITHENALKSSLTLNENLKLYNLLDNRSDISTSSVIDQLKINSVLNSLVINLSAGQKRKIALARLNMTLKPIWILDEPFTSLDQATQNLLYNWIDTHLQNNGLVILTSHQPLPFSNYQTLELGGYGV